LEVVKLIKHLEHFWMEIKEFREKVRPGRELIVEGQSFKVNQVIKFRLDDGSFYFKCYLSDDKVIAEDSEMNVYIFVKPVETDFAKPMPKQLSYDDKSFEFLYEAHAVAEEVYGVGDFKQGESETFWDYKAQDDSYLSLGINDKDQAKADFYGKTIATEFVEVK
jgi:hypothetical protein